MFALTWDGYPDRQMISLYCCMIVTYLNSSNLHLNLAITRYGRRCRITALYRGSSVIIIGESHVDDVFAVSEVFRPVILNLFISMGHFCD